jgi:G6PDH family F420-dependent oxidoreductase
MATIGCFLSSEENGPQTLVETARKAEAAGFDSVLISDHYHPWIDRQGESPFVWSVIGAIAATTKLRVTTGVTCPTMRVHPAVLAQAAATSQLLLDGRFVFGVGSGENLNEHIFGDRWPPADMRLAMLEEAIEVIRLLWCGDEVTHRGRYYTVEDARIYSRPDTPPPIAVSGFGPKSVSLAARVGDGYVTTAPDAESIRSYRDQGGKGPVIAAVKVCWDRDESAAAKRAYELWPTTGVPGQLSQDLRVPALFEEASQNVTEEMVTGKIPCGPDPARFVGTITKYLDAGADEVYVGQIGDDQAGFFEFFNAEVRPNLAA